jgi:hypothetical protein
MAITAARIASTVIGRVVPDPGRPVTAGETDRDGGPLIARPVESHAHEAGH